MDITAACNGSNVPILFPEIILKRQKCRLLLLHKNLTNNNNAFKDFQLSILLKTQDECKKLLIKYSRNFIWTTMVFKLFRLKKKSPPFRIKPVNRLYAIVADKNWNYSLQNSSSNPSI